MSSLIELPLINILFISQATTVIQSQIHRNALRSRMINIQLKGRHPRFPRFYKLRFSLKQQLKKVKADESRRKDGSG